jgi:tetratricopeptide (TPR) repeat protein
MLQHIIKALDEVKETDYQWRLSLMIILIKSQLANNQLDEANKTAQSILQLVRQHLPSLIIQTHKHICECGLNDVKGSDRDIKKHPQLQILLRIWKLKCHISIGDFEHKLGRIYHQLAEGSSDSSLQTDDDDMPTHTIYIEMAELAMQGSCYDLANKCIEAINIDDSMELYNRYQLLKGQLMVASLAPDDYAPSAIQLRQNAITLCEEVLKSCTDKNTKDESLIEPTCVVIWNMSLPLLQPPLRLFLYRPLTAIINALSTMDSVLDVLRFNVHSELVKISSDMSNTDGALTHVDSAMKLIEHDKRDHVRSLMFIKRRLELKKELYITPTDPLDQAIQLMEQVIHWSMQAAIRYY